MTAANTLMGISVAMSTGYFAFGSLAERLARRGIQPMTVAASGMLCFIVVQGMIVLQMVDMTLLIWLLFGFFGTACILPYAALSQSFPRHLSGRVNTRLNLLVFVAAFDAQGVIGLIIDLGQQTVSGGYKAAGYSSSFGRVAILHLAGAIWYFLAIGRNSLSDSHRR